MSGSVRGVRSNAHSYRDCGGDRGNPVSYRDRNDTLCVSVQRSGSPVFSCKVDVFPAEGREVCPEVLRDL